MKDLVTNHNEAWSLAHMQRKHSNLSRCYIELRELVQKLFAYSGVRIEPGSIIPDEWEAARVLLLEISKANGL